MGLVSPSKHRSGGLCPTPGEQPPPLPPGAVTMPVSSSLPPSFSSTTLPKLLALDEEREKSRSASDFWARASTLERRSGQAPPPLPGHTPQQGSSACSSPPQDLALSRKAALGKEISPLPREV